MIGITIEDFDDRNVLSVDLKDILRAAGSRAWRSNWRISDVEVSGGEAAAELDQLSRTGEVVSGARLIDLAGRVWQVIDGKFEGFDSSTLRPWIVIYAVDSSAYDIVTNDSDLLEKLRTMFKNVRDMPESAL